MRFFNTNISHALIFGAISAFITNLWEMIPFGIFIFLYADGAVFGIVTSLYFLFFENVQKKVTFLKLLLWIIFCSLAYWFVATITPRLDSLSHHPFCVVGCGPFSINFVVAGLVGAIIVVSAYRIIRKISLYGMVITIIYGALIPAMSSVLYYITKDIRVEFAFLFFLWQIGVFGLLTLYTENEKLIDDVGEGERK